MTGKIWTPPGAGAIAPPALEKHPIGGKQLEVPTAPPPDTIHLPRDPQMMAGLVAGMVHTQVCLLREAVALRAELAELRAALEAIQNPAALA